MKAKILTSKELIIVLLLTTIFFLSCKGVCKRRTVEMYALNIETNYFDNDSLQRKGGYYPARVYVIFQIINTSTEPVFIPIKAKSDTVTKSYIKVYDPNNLIKDSYAYVMPNKILAPNDTMYVEFIMALRNDSNQIVKGLSNFATDIQFSYEFNEEDSVISKNAVPATIEIKRATNFKMKYRDKQSIDEDVEWTL